MNIEITMLAVPVMAAVVLGTLLATAGRKLRSLSLGMMGVFGVTFGGPGAVFVLGVSLPQRASHAADIVESSKSAADGTIAETDAAVAEIELEPSDAAVDDQTATSLSESAAEDPLVEEIETLNEPIEDRVRYLAARPEWVDSITVRGQSHDTISVSSGPCSRTQDCVKELESEIQKAANEYVNWHVGNAVAANFVGFDLGYIDRHLIHEERFHEHLIVPQVGPMQQTHALLEFDDSARAEIDRRWTEAKTTSRLLVTGLFGAAALGLLSVLFGFFKLDNATRGFYTGRLQFAALAGILGLVAAGVLVARWIPWL